MALTWNYVLSGGKATEVTASGYAGEASIEIPATIDGYDVDSINGASATTNFLGQSANQTTLTSITFASGFAGTIIHQNCFSKLGGLTSLLLPNSIIELKTNAMAYSGLTSLTLSSALTTIGYDFIRNYSNSPKITHLIIPASVTSMSNRALWGNPCIKISVQSGNTVYKMQGNYLVNYAKTKIIGYANACGETNIIIPTNLTFNSNGTMGFTANRYAQKIYLHKNITDIPSYFVEGCPNLNTIYFGSGVTTIGTMAMASCPLLLNIWHNGAKPTTIGTNAYWSASVAGRVYKTNGWAYVSGDFTGWEYAGTQQTLASHDVALTSNYGVPNYTSATVLTDSYFVLPSKTDGTLVRWYSGTTYIGQSEEAVQVSSALTLTDGPVAIRAGPMDIKKIYQNGYPVDVLYAEKHAQDAIIITSTSAV
ncbi:MAG: leucine-rich repeat domain-containing protein, partial [Candidatus Cloacimonetes bacterium]|nr:leucine-rich repeat domain-containing protein [Candidatus Cloacimonadota bacterium]